MIKTYEDLLLMIINDNEHDPKQITKAKAKASRLLELLEDGHELTKRERLELLKIAGVKKAGASSKIAGAYVFNSCAIGCAFCKAMKKEAEADPSHICGYCYAEAGERRLPVVEYYHIISMIIFASVLFTVEELKAAKLVSKWYGTVIRFNESGDLANVTMARNWLRVCEAYPKAHCGLYTKNAIALSIAVKYEGKPSNVSFVYSSKHTNEAEDIPEIFDFSFTVYDEANISEAVEGGAKCCECGNGDLEGACDRCLWKCYGGSLNEYGWKKGTNIAEKLRKKGGKKKSKK